jgi:hypothetical protein
MLKTGNLHAKFAKSRETAKNVRILRTEMALLRTKKELRKNKKDEEEGKTFVFVVLFFGLERRRCRLKAGHVETPERTVTHCFGSFGRCCRFESIMFSVRYT